MHCNQGGSLVCDGTNLKQWYRTLVSSSLSMIAFGRDSEKLVQSIQMAVYFEPWWLQYLARCWIHLKVIIKMVMWSVSCLLWCNHSVLYVHAWYAPRHQHLRCLHWADNLTATLHNYMVRLNLEFKRRGKILSVSKVLAEIFLTGYGVSSPLQTWLLSPPLSLSLHHKLTNRHVDYSLNTS